MPWCYLVIQPHPGTTWEVQLDQNGQQAIVYHVKFGDGDPGGAYQRANANHGIVLNGNSVATTVATIDARTGRTITRGPGKFLEHHLLRIAGNPDDPNPYAGTEWHALVLNPGQDLNQLRQVLCDLLSLFPRYNTWVEDPDVATRQGNPASIDQQFEDLWHRLCWDEDGTTRLATLIN